MRTEPNEYAFPTGGQFGVGLTKREWFVGMAMAGAAATYSDFRSLADRAVRQADALIAELNKEESK